MALCGRLPVRRVGSNGAMRKLRCYVRQPCNRNIAPPVTRVNRRKAVVSTVKPEVPTPVWAGACRHEKRPLYLLAVASFLLSVIANTPLSGLGKGAEYDSTDLPPRGVVVGAEGAV